MWPIIKNILESPAGSFGAVFSVLCLLFWVVYRAGRVIEKFTIVEKLETNIDRIKSDIMEINAFINLFRQRNDRFTQAHSPISLTELGNEVVGDLKADRMVGLRWSEILDKIKKILKKEDNPYTIQEICFEIGKNYSDFTTKDELDQIKTYAFNKGYNISDFYNIFGVLIRDKYFTENNINVKDVDNHDPKKTIV